MECSCKLGWPDNVPKPSLTHPKLEWNINESSLTTAHLRQETTHGSLREWGIILEESLKVNMDLLSVIISGVDLSHIVLLMRWTVWQIAILKGHKRKSQINLKCQICDHPLRLDTRAPEWEEQGEKGQQPDIILALMWTRWRHREENTTYSWCLLDNGSFKEPSVFSSKILEEGFHFNDKLLHAFSYRMTTKMPVLHEKEVTKIPVVPSWFPVT